MSVYGTPAKLRPIPVFETDELGNPSASFGGSTSALVSKSGTITLGGTAQVLAAANASRQGLRIQNQSTGDLWVSDVGTAAATQPSEWLPAGSFFEFPVVPTGAISIFGATTGQAFAAREW